MCLLMLPSTLSAAEVTNLTTVFSSSRLTLEYDLTGTGMETESAVDVHIEVGDRKYASNMLSLSGDFGRSVRLGPHRQVIWDHLLDFPEGLDSVFRCSVNAIPDSKVPDEGLLPAEGFRGGFFAISRQTIVETRTQLMWARNANIPVKAVTYTDAQRLIERLNRERFAGYNDWRIPTRDDFEGLIYYGKKAGWGTGIAHFIADYLVTCGFSNVQPGNYWTTTPVDASTNRLFVANTWNGILRPLEQVNYYHLWPVRTVR
jgi:hypothetical protein